MNKSKEEDRIAQYHKNAVEPMILKLFYPLISVKRNYRKRYIVVRKYTTENSIILIYV